MPPLTRSSINGGRRKVQTLNIHEDDPDTASGTDQVEDDQSDEDLFSPVDDPQSPPKSTAQDILQPLQETANRVSRQVEEFAKCLDQFNEERGADDQSLWEDSWHLLEQFSKTASNRAKQAVSSSSRSGRQRHSVGVNSEIQRLELEADLWALVKDLLVCGSPKSLLQAQANQESRLADLHRYTNNTDLWNAFLDSDVIGQEYECMLAWLQERAANTYPSIEETLAEQLAKSERGDGVWSAGPMFTKTAIKSEKRRRAWPLPFDPSNPSLTSTHKRASDGMKLVAQLDPDAQTRENAVLQLQDEFHEEASWMTCWEMLRRGYVVEDIRKWWTDRKEVWRSTVMRGCDSGPNQQIDSPWLRMINLASNQKWADCCDALCQSKQLSSQYQSAVYGLLCGNVAASRQICTNIDDNLFSILNTLLIDRYQSYLLAFRKKVENSSAATYQQPPASGDQIRQYLKYAQTDKQTKVEALESHKFIEMAVIGKEFDQFFVQLGQSAAQIAHSSGEFSHLMLEDPDSPINECGQVTAQDQDGVRVVAHLQLVLRSLGLLQASYEDHLYEMENNIANYIGWLEKEKKFTLIPLYAGKLSPERTRHVLGAVLVKVVEPKERKYQIRLMKQYQINISDVIYGIFYLANYDKIEEYRQGQTEFKRATITEKVGEGNAKMTKTRAEFMSEELSLADEKAIESVEWYEFIDAKNWGRAAWSVSLLYKIFLYQGKFAALRELLKRVSLGKLSLDALHMNLNFADESDEGSGSRDIDMDGGDEEEIQTISPSRKRKGQKLEHPLARAGESREMLYNKSLVWKQLEQLVIALDALQRWQDRADDMESNRSNIAQMRTLKHKLLRAFDEVREAMLPLVEPDFLCHANDEKEETYLNTIRNHYIPECILGYNAVLYFAGHSLSRGHLADCMELAQVVAQTPMLTNAFVESGRMRELVTAFALDSQALLHANEQGASKTKRGKKKPNTEIWQVSWKGSAPADLEATEK